MTQLGVSLCDQDYMFHFPGRSITVEKNSGKECKKIPGLASREERAALLKAGFTGKDIESEYLRRNRITIIGVNWQE